MSISIVPLPQSPEFDAPRLGSLNRALRLKDSSNVSPLDKLDEIPFPLDCQEELRRRIQAGKTSNDASPEAKRHTALALFSNCASVTSEPPIPPMRSDPLSSKRRRTSAHRWRVQPCRACAGRRSAECDGAQCVRYGAKRSRFAPAARQRKAPRQTTTLDPARQGMETAPLPAPLHIDHSPRWSSNLAGCDPEPARACRETRRRIFAQKAIGVSRCPQRCSISDVA